MNNEIYVIDEKEAVVVPRRVEKKEGIEDQPHDQRRLRHRLPATRNTPSRLHSETVGHGLSKDGELL
jgi:hypothetical protein